MDDEQIKALVTDLHWQIDQLGPRGIKNTAGNPFVPTQFKRKLQEAEGGEEVVALVQGVVHKAPNQGFKRLEAAESLDLACEALVADDSKPYSGLFTDEDREAARKRLAPHAEQIAKRTQEHRDRMDAARAKLRNEGMPLRHELDAQLRRRRVTR